MAIVFHTKMWVCYCDTDTFYKVFIGNRSIMVMFLRNNNQNKVTHSLCFLFYLLLLWSPVANCEVKQFLIPVCVHYFCLSCVDLSVVFHVLIIWKCTCRENLFIQLHLPYIYSNMYILISRPILYRIQHRKMLARSFRTVSGPKHRNI